MKTPLLLNDLGFHQVSSRFSLFKIQPRLLEASQCLEMLWRSRVPRPNPLDTKEYLNFYEYHRGRPLVWREGRPAFDTLEFLLATVDFSFIRHIAAPFYKMYNQQPIHDPPNLYAIHLWKMAEGLHHEEAIRLLQHPRKGKEGRELLRLELEQVPKTYTVLTRFLERLGDEGMFRISRGFLWILVRAGVLVGPIHEAIDGQLLPSFSHYHGCNGFQPACGQVSVSLETIRAALEQVLAKLEPQLPKLTAVGISSQRHLVSIPCPFQVTGAQKKTPHQIRLGWLRLFPKSRPGFGPDQTAHFGLDLPWLLAHQLGVRLEAPVFTQTSARDCVFRCPRLPSDPSVRIGWKNSNQPDGDPEPVFGVDLEQLTLLIPELGLELPVGALGSPGNSPTRLPELLQLFDDTGKQLRPVTASLDARYDALDNYALLRCRGTTPIIALIHHKGEATPEAAARRGVTMDGIPLACCGEPMKSNGFDALARRRSFICGQDKSPQACARCPYGPERRSLGQVAHVSVDQFPRYACEIGRHSPGWQAHYDQRTAAERVHGDLVLMAPLAVANPRLRGLTKLAANAALAHHLLLWRRLFTFVSDVTHLDELVGLYQSTVDEAVLVYNVATLHQLPDSLVRGLLPSHFT